MNTAVPEVAPDSVLKNCTFDKLKVRDSASLVLAEGRYPVKAKPIALNDIRVPIFHTSAEAARRSGFR
jgi:hypothetical protein